MSVNQSPETQALFEQDKIELDYFLHPNLGFGPGQQGRRIEFRPWTEEGRRLAQERIGLTGRKYDEYDEAVRTKRPDIRESRWKTRTPNTVLLRTEWDPKGDGTSWQITEEKYVRLAQKDFDQEYGPQEIW
ncbi:MAG: hypothetical protein UY21_C0006G0017 [Microgenomates group bacterium GW2011_GWA1_48_10]|uniref:Uncharacterized protein n=1 Tax=Candidatus Gottesmanbacteria bacterium RIFCSPHIGHO2_01_FULL_47_48 TaxID=1798381 RepID=A0A1F6A3Z3_9BACT|nr:MAG: hypothetical protein UY21_C0006G0017 [Microgenomates group bacterium GW2011_GWA1_48_10]OGG19403.1 MAG: hypothetical protein A2721_02655 [Candidatus Gottesmanbacteria bacterium RIFCSPHIGHO2_01_FULL_47_48]